MLCWLEFYKFDKNDVYIFKSELFGSYLPVYAA